MRSTPLVPPHQHHDLQPLHSIARAIRADWSNMSTDAVPYVSAMEQIGDITDRYVQIDGREVVTYFLTNAGSWRGEVARAVKAELRWQLAETR